MSDPEYRCFIGGLAWSTTDRSLRDAFEKFGHLTEAKVVVDRMTGRSRGFGFITFEEREAMEDAIERMNGLDLEGRIITVDKAQPGKEREDRGGRDYGGGRGSNSGECFKCGKPGHFARECPSGDGGRGDRYGGRDDRYSSRDDRYGGRDDRYGSRDDRYGGGSGGGGSGRYGPDRNGDRYGGGRSREVSGRGGSGGDRYSSYSRDRSGPYERSGGSYR